VKPTPSTACTVSSPQSLSATRLSGHGRPRCGLHRSRACRGRGSHPAAADRAGHGVLPWAEVVRRGTLEIPQGKHHVIVRGLPAVLDEDALRVAMGSQGARLGEVELRNITQAEHVGESERPLRRQPRRAG
jgi:hypothetical protein